MLSIAALLFVAAPSPQTPPLAGLYRINQMEMAGGLELRPDGRFRYALEYGAVSETGEGDWSVTPDGVALTSNPMPKVRGITSGLAAFDRQPLRKKGEALILERFDTSIRFLPDQP
jgi:hypothetical protein